MYHFTYTVVGNTPCGTADATVTVTVIVLPNAGTDSTLNVCSDGGTTDLFALLGASADAGGTWSPALASGTGIFDPTVDLAGVYTYTVNSALCGSDDATITVTIIQAANAGGVGQTINACISETSVDLTTGLDGTQDAGTWSDDDGTGALTGNIFNPSLVAAGLYHFTYTVVGNTPCGTADATVTVTVIVLPNAGTFTGIVSVCPSVGIFDLNSLLSDQDINGTWTDSNDVVVTSPVTIITLAEGTYSYTYTVDSTFCGNDTEVVQFAVLPNPQIATTNIAVAPICIGSDATVNLTGMIDGTYTLNYDLLGSNALANQTVIVTIASGNGSFTIPTASISNIGTTVISLTSIQNNTSTCSVTLTNVATNFVINPLVAIDDSNLSVTNVCFGNDVIVNIANAINLPDGVYQFNYTIPTGNPTTGNSGDVTITTGVGQFTIPASAFTTAAIYSIIINGIVATTGCSNANENATTNFEILPLPNVTGATLTAQTTCANFTSEVTISNASNLADGTYSITYQ